MRGDGESHIAESPPVLSHTKWAPKVVNSEYRKIIRSCINPRQFGLMFILFGEMLGPLGASGCSGSLTCRKFSFPWQNHFEREGGGSAGLKEVSGEDLHIRAWVGLWDNWTTLSTYLDLG